MGCQDCKIKRIRVDGEIFSSDILIVGESPGNTEEALGKPFVGDSGKLLNQMLYTYLDKDRSEVPVTNACRCQIPQEIKKVKSMLKKIILPCREYLVQDIFKVRPKLIIALGEIALSQLMNKWMTISRNRGLLIYSQEFNCYIYPIYHPSYILRNGGVNSKNPSWLIWEKDWKFIGEYLRQEHKVIENSYFPYRSNKEFSSAFLALDAEWDDKENLIVFSISNNKVTRYVLFKELDNRTALSLNKLFHRKIIVFANRPSDERILLKHGIPLENCYKVDIFNMANLINENIQINLENIAELYTDERKIKEESKKVGKKVWLMKEADLIRYNCKDAEVTAKAFKVLYKELKKDEKLYRYWEKFILPVEEMLATIGMQGFRIDTEKLKINKAFVEGEKVKLEMELLSMIHPKIIEQHRDAGLKFTRDRFILDILFNSRYGLRLKAKEFTPTGLPSLEESHLLQFKDNRFVGKFLLWKHLEKLINTFFNGIERNLKEDGKIYPNIVLYSTKTGRTACYNPNLQQIPRDGYLVDKLKELYEAPEGWLLCARDLSQSEIRVVAWHANEKNILEALRKKIDIHSLTASFLLNKKINEVTKEERQLAKPVNFGFIYGQSASGFQKYALNEYGLNFSLEEAERIRKKFFEAYPSLPIYHRKCIEIARKYGYVRSVLGRIRRLPHINSKDYTLSSYAERQAVNFPIQSFSSDLALIGMYLFWKEVKDKKSIQVLWFIHDSVFFMCREDLVEKYMALLKECMEERAKEYIYRNFKVKVGYPIETDGKVGKNWAVMEDFQI